MREPLTVLFLCLLLHCTLQGTLSQSHTCSYQDEESGYTLSWTAGVGFVDFFFNYKHFPTRAAHWTGVGFGDEILQVALIESQLGRITIASATTTPDADHPPLKLPTANMVTRGYGSIDEKRLQASFSVPIYYFKDCETWTFYTNPTQIGSTYHGIPKTRQVCNATKLCQTPKIPHRFKSYPQQQQTESSGLSIQLPSEVSKFLDQPVDADFDIKGGLHLGQNKANAANIRYSPQNSAQYSNQRQYDQQYGYQPSSNGLYNQQPQSQYQQSNYPQQQYGSNSYDQQYGYQQPNYNQQSQYGQSYQQPNYNQQQPNYNQGNSQNMGTLDNLNYKFLPDGLNYQYEANSGRSRFYDNNGNPIGIQVNGALTQEPVRSNADQNRLNYQDISTHTSPNNNPNSQQYTNNIYGYDYRSNSGSKYTINGNEQQYQPPKNRLNPGGRKKRQSSFRGTAYENQDLKFPRVENTVPSSINYDDSRNNNNNFNRQPTNFQQGSAMYYPYRTDTNPNIASPSSQQQFYSPPQHYGTYTTNNRFDPNAQPLSPYYINPYGQNDNSPYNSNYYNPASNLYPNRTHVNNPYLISNNPQTSDTHPYNPANHNDDVTRCQGPPDPSWCRDYVKHFSEWFKSYGGTQTEALCPSLRNSLSHTDHHCCRALEAVNC